MTGVLVTQRFAVAISVSRPKWHELVLSQITQIFPEVANQIETGHRSGAYDTGGEVVTGS